MVNNPLYVTAILIPLFCLCFRLFAKSFAILLYVKGVTQFNSIVMQWSLLALPIACVILFVPPSHQPYAIRTVLVISILDLCYVLYQLYIGYRNTLSAAEEIVSDDFAPYINWMRNCCIGFFVWFVLGLSMFNMTTTYLIIYGVAGYYYLRFNIIL